MANQNTAASVAGSETQWDFTYDEAIVAGEASRLALYTDDGSRHEADSLTTVDGDALRASFPDVDDFADQVTLAVAGREAVTGNNSGQAASTLAVERIGDTDVRIGATAGPDLPRTSRRRRRPGAAALRRVGRR